MKFTKITRHGHLSSRTELPEAVYDVFGPNRYKRMIVLCEGYPDFEAEYLEYTDANAIYVLKNVRVIGANNLGAEVNEYALSFDDYTEKKRPAATTLSGLVEQLLARNPLDTYERDNIFYCHYCGTEAARMPGFGHIPRHANDCIYMLLKEAVLNE